MLSNSLSAANKLIASGCCVEFSNTRRTQFSHQTVLGKSIRVSPKIWGKRKSIPSTDTSATNNSSSSPNLWIF